METEEQIPCAKCHLWKSKEKKFSCKPNECKELSIWLFQYAGELKPEVEETKAQRQGTVIQYVV